MGDEPGASVHILSPKPGMDPCLLTTHPILPPPPRPYHAGRGSRVGSAYLGVPGLPSPGVPGSPGPAPAAALSCGF